MKTQDELANESGIHFDRLRAILARSKPKEATLDELVALARVTGVPKRFALEGFDAIPNEGDRIANIEARLRGIEQRLPEPPGELGRFRAAGQPKAQDPRRR